MRKKNSNTEIKGAVFRGDISHFTYRVIHNYCLLLWYTFRSKAATAIAFSICQFAQNDILLAGRLMFLTFRRTFIFCNNYKWSLASLIKYSRSTWKLLVKTKVYTWYGLTINKLSAHEPCTVKTVKNKIICTMLCHYFLIVPIV